MKKKIRNEKKNKNARFGKASRNNQRNMRFQQDKFTESESEFQYDFINSPLQITDQNDISNSQETQENIKTKEEEPKSVKSAPNGNEENLFEQLWDKLYESVEHPEANNDEIDDDFYYF